MTKRGWTRRGALLATTGAVAACGVQSVETPVYEGEVSFVHGVASGDPKHDRVIIWTRVSPVNAGPVPVRWIVARNRELSDVVKTGVFEANEGRDYTVKVDVTGLRAGAPYFYGFRAGAAESVVGKTRTLPRGRTEELKIGVASCASHPHGFFNAYKALSERDDLAVIVHLGDYIYEYGLSGYGGDVALQLGRVPSPEVECTRLEDYRQRHAQYKGQAELQAAHAAAPWIVVWDDHEVANDSFTNGAENHDQNEGQWATRKQAALQAYYEWMPIREPETGRAFEAINRSFQFGDLFTLIMLETRLLARTQPLDYATNLPIQTQRWNFANPQAPVALREHEADVPQMQRLPAIYEEVGEELRPVLDWRRAEGLIQQARDLPAGFFLAPDVEAIDEALNAPDRQLLGEAQEQWLAQELSRSKAASTPWQIIGNQVLVARVDAPDLSATPPQLAAALERLRPGVTQLLKLTRFPFPLNTDAWDGYPASRARLLQSIRAAGGNTIVITGDTHAAWANEIEDEQGRVAVEFGATSITSPSDASFFQPFGIDFAANTLARNPHVKWNDPILHGFLVLTLTPAQALAEFFTVSTITEAQYEVAREAAFTVAADAGAGVGAITEAT
ncbi:MAG: alkaline phosphatase D family protein [Hyphomonadaceae bacterium]|nr:alkaline phosphatase D family protein [Hyphomonadaceae bacterium]